MYAMVSVDQKMLTELQASFFSVKEEQGKEKKTTFKTLYCLPFL